MQSQDTTLERRLRALDGVTDVESYPTDNDLSTHDVSDPPLKGWASALFPL